MAKNQPKKTGSILGGTVIRNAFSIQSKTLAGRKVTPRNKQGEPLAYCLYDVVNRCGDLILKNIESKTDLNNILDNALRDEKTKQEIRKLKIGNDSQESKVVNAIDIEIETNNGYKVIADNLSSISEDFYMQNSDITDQQLESLNSILEEARSKIISNCN